MGLISGYENDAFISYSHIDNQPFSMPERRWVEIFHGHLQTFVDVHLGQRARIWRDARLTGAEVFSDEISRGLAASAVLVPVLSPGYMKSDWCRKELVNFSAAARARGGLHVGTLHRVLKVLRLPVARTLLPPDLDTTVGTSFFRIDPQSERARDLLLDPSADAMQVFLARVDDVAQDLARLLRAMAPPPAGDRPAPDAHAAAPPAGRLVYLAWTSSDLSVERDRLRRELEAHGHRVVPQADHPLDAVQLQSMVKIALSDADVAVHLVGSKYGLVPEGESRSVVELQLDDTTFEASGSQAARIIWLAPQPSPVPDPRVAAMLAGVQRPQVDVLVNQSLEVLKTLVLDRLKSGPETAPAFARNVVDSAAVYLLCDQLDGREIAPIRDYFFERSLEVRLPLFVGDAQDIRAEHYETLKECDGVFVYWGRGSESWLRTMLRDLKKVFGLGRKRPFKARLLMLGGPFDAGKQAFRTHELPVVGAGTGFDAELFQPFLSEVRVTA